MKPADYNIFRLANGLRCVHCPAEGKVSYIGLAVNAGSRDDAAVSSGSGRDTNGLAHFVEHTVFKGTEHRQSWHINNRMESVGGELNAYTSKEETLIYTIAPEGNTARAIELLYDLAAYCNFPASEIEKERDVVIEEIYSYLDSPADSVFDEFEDRIYSGSGLGHNILGSTESVKGLAGADCRAFIDRFYNPANMVLYIIDSSPARKVEAVANRYFGRLSHQAYSRRQPVPPMNTAFSERIERQGHQAHTIIGTRIFNRYDDRRFALFLLNNYLGGPGMNSRLNYELREKRGYVYTVESNLALMSDCGLWTVYFGCDPESVDRCSRLIKREIMKLAESAMKADTLSRIKRQYIGQMKVATEQRESMAMGLGKSLLYYDEIHDTDWTAERIEAVTPEDIRSVAEMLLPQKCSSLTLC